MKRLLLLLLLVPSKFTIYAQGFKVGGTIGAGFYGTYNNLPPMGGFNAGVPIRFELTRKWAIETALLYNVYSYQQAYTTSCNIMPRIPSLTPNLIRISTRQNVQLPLLIDFNFGKGKRKTTFSLSAGAGASLYLSQRNKLEQNCNGNIETTYSDNISGSRLKPWWHLGLNLNYKQNERYSYTLSLIDRRYISHGSQFDILSTSLLFSAFYELKHLKPHTG